MSKFKVGDIVVGNRLASQSYSITKEGWKGKVIEVRNDGWFIAQEPSDHQVTYTLNERYFDLVEEPKEKETEMKTKFQVGDLVIGKKLVGEPLYAITGEGWVGEVKSVAEEDYIEVEDLGGRGVWQVDPTHFDLVYKKGEYCKGSRKFLMEAYKEGITNFMPRIRAILALDPISDLLPVPKSLIDEAFSNVCSDWRKKIIEEFKYNKQNPYFSFGEKPKISYTISATFGNGPLMIGYGLGSDEEEEGRCLLVSSEYELIVEDLRGYKKLKFKKK